MNTIKNITFLLFTTMLTCTNVNAKNSNKDWNILVGLGQSHPGWGDTKKTVKTTDLIFQQEVKQDAIRGDEFKYKRSILLEIPVHIVRSPYSSYMTGLNAYSKWTHVNNDKIQPFVLAGGGGLYTNADIPGTSSKIRGTYGAGIGLQINANKDLKYSIETRYHHVSNGGLKSPNDPLNSHKILFGISLKI